MAGSDSAEVVVITGPGAGVGRAIARRFAAPGVRIGLLGRNEDSLAAARAEVEEAGGEALAIPTDVADPDAVEAAAQAVEEALGPIDVWVNNSMTTVFSFFDEITPEEYRRATDVTYHGTVWGTMAALKRMKDRDRGTIVQVGSAMAYRGIPLQAPYCGAKHAIKGFVDSVRCELRNQGSSVHVTMVQLPGLNTPQFDHCRSKMPNHPMPVPPIYQPEVAAEAVHFAAHARRREVWVGIPTIYTILGERLAPWLAERYLARTAVKGQQTDGPPSEKNSEGNIFSPHGGDPGAHGRFDADAHSSSVQLALTRRRGPLAAGVLAAAGAASAALLARG
jgi:NAD(P)-dependent dehydrogenase (short-subunit alcohol dehydrogenase family)